MELPVTSIQDVLARRALEERGWLILPTDPVTSSHAAHVTFGDVYKGAESCAAELRRKGGAYGQNIGIVLDNGPAFCFAFFGALLAGMTPTPLPLPHLRNLDQYARRLLRAARCCELRHLLVDGRLASALKGVEGLPEVLPFEPTGFAGALSQQQLFPGRPEDVALIQHTSGSTGAQRAVELTHRALLSNVVGIGRALGVTSDDVDASWLPMFHDMGLIGTLLFSLYWGIPLVLLKPRDFLHRPQNWLWSVSRFSATLSAAPNFAYQMCASLPEKEDLRGLDLRSWRAAITGSELVHPSTLESFCTRFAPYGFDGKALLPAYGLAENTLAVSLTAWGCRRTDRVDREALERRGTARQAQGGRCRTIVSVGRALSGQEVRITDDHGRVLPERRIGEIQVRGPSVMKGCRNDPEATQRAFAPDGWLKTGDRGYLADGELYVVGRAKALIKKAGAGYDAAEIEQVVRQSDSVRIGQVIALGIPNAVRGTEDLVILVETEEREGVMLRQMAASIARSVGATCNTQPDRIHFVKPKTLPKTTSGKPQNEYAKMLYLQGAFDSRNLSFAAA